MASSPAPACPTRWLWSLAGPSVGSRQAQGCPKCGAALLEHSPAVLQGGTARFLPFPSGVSNSEACTEEKSERSCTVLLPGASGADQPSLVLPGAGELCHGAGELPLEGRCQR